MAGAAAVTLAPPAMADDFNFSFEGIPGAAGTVNGTLFGLPTTGTARPTNVTAMFRGVTYTYPAGTVYGSGFTTSDGVITGADFQAFLTNDGNLNLGLGGFNQLLTGNGGVVLNAGGFSGATYSRVTPATGAVPEPATWAMMILGMGAVGYTLRGRRKAARLSAAA